MIITSFSLLYLHVFSGANPFNVHSAAGFVISLIESRLVGR